MRLNNKEVVDATEDAAIEVFEADAIKGVPRDPKNCPTAMAGRRAFRSSEVIVQNKVVYVLKGNKYIRYHKSTKLVIGVQIQDHGGKFPVGTYILKVPVRKLGTFKPTGPKKTNGTKRNVSRTVAFVRPAAVLKRR